MIVAQGAEHPRLFSNGLEADQIHWVDRKPLLEPLCCTVKTRYRQQDIAATVTAVGEDRLEVIFDQPQAAVTPGQSVVFYQGEICLGGAIIDKRICSPEQSGELR